MSKNHLLFLFLLFVKSVELFGQMPPELNGARAAATGMAAVTITDIWAIQNNIGALAGLEVPVIAFSYNTRLQLQELTTFGALAGIPLKHGVAAVSFSRFGTGAYRIQTAGIGYSHKINIFSLGVKLSYLQQSIEGYASSGTLITEAGGKAELFPNLYFAAHAYNLSQSSFSYGGESRLIPVILKAGFIYLPSDKISLLIQTFKDVNFPASFSAGIDYQIIKSLSLRTGISTAPVTGSFGLEFRLHRFSFGYAFRQHNHLGALHHISTSFSFGSNTTQ